MKALTRLFCVLACFVMVYPACKDDGGGTAKPRETLRIGVILPATGAAASAGESANAALQIAQIKVTEHLQSTGDDIDIDLVIRDSQSDPDAALQTLQELVGLGIDRVIGPFTSANVAAVLDYANDHDIFLLSPASVATSLSIPDDNLYRLVPSDGAQAEAMAALFAHDNLTGVIPVVRDDVWGNSLLNDISEALLNHSVAMATPVLYDPADPDTSQIILDIKLSNNFPFFRPIGLYFLTFGEGTDLLSAVSNMFPISPHPTTLYGSSAYANNSTLLHNVTARTYAQQHALRCPAFAPDPALMDRWGPIEDALANVLGRTPEIYALTTYDAVWAMAMAYLLCPDPDDIVKFKISFEALAETYEGITGRIALDAAGDRQYAAFNFWGVEMDGGEYTWKSFGHYNNATGELVID